ncbi:MAG: putative anti-sigma regulatory factor, serine/threonine protein kinase [Solirubrobacterales bacterium]|nr:putative anti-sigma regulatory factor, serine/threonine protein kinase [Solirubrobacterales bacterium]
MASAVSALRCAGVQFLRDHGVAEELAEDINLALSEAVSNAVLHAFRCQEQPGNVWVTITIASGGPIEVIVRDDGMGLSPRDDSPGLGLGLSIISRLADQVEQDTPRDGPGCELRMRFRL